MDYYTEIQKELNIDAHNNLNKSPEPHAKWRKSQLHKITYFVTPFVEYFWNEDIIDTKNKAAVWGRLQQSVVGREVGMVIKGNRNSGGVVNTHHVNILDVRLHKKFARYCHCGKTE